MDREQTYGSEKPKPELLYHASSNPNIEEFEPRAEKVRDSLEGPVIFATPDKAYATCFLVPTDNSWAKIGRWSTDGQPGPWNVVISDKARFDELDKGGIIYSLPSAGFNFDANKNMGEIEWTSPTAVKPVKKEAYTSGLEAMRVAGVRVYFVDADTFTAIENADDHGKSIIDVLKPTAH